MSTTVTTIRTKQEATFFIMVTAMMMATNAMP